jgi:hypothetical protein
MTATPPILDIYLHIRVVISIIVAANAPYSSTSSNH